VDALLAEVKQLREVVRRLTENAGIDFANPKRGVNAGDTPSARNPVYQKLSSLADVQSYNVADGQVLSWSQQGQKWLPVTPTSGGAVVDIPMAYSDGYESPVVGTGWFDVPSGEWAYFGTGDYGNAEMWGTYAAYIGAGSWQDGPLALVEATKDGFGRPYVQISANDYADGTYGAFTVYSYGIRMDVPAFQNPRVTTAARPVYTGSVYSDQGNQTFDRNLNIPIWWNGTSWVNALGTAV